LGSASATDTASPQGGVISVGAIVGGVVGGVVLLVLLVLLFLFVVRPRLTGKRSGRSPYSQPYGTTSSTQLFQSDTELGAVAPRPPSPFAPSPVFSPLMAAAPAAPPTLAPAPSHQAKYRFSPGQPDELPLVVGEPVRVLRTTEDGWVQVRAMRTGRVGLVPSNYLEPLAPAPAQAPKPRPGGRNPLL
jgi:hypothetical protein